MNRKSFLKRSGLALTPVLLPTIPAWAQEKNHQARLFQFHGDRERIILGTSQAALNWLRLALLE